MNLQPSELRLGILVYDSLRQKNITIQLKHFRELAISEKAFFDRYKAILITEEWLLGFGFHKIDKSPNGFKYAIGIADWGFTIENSFKANTWFFGHEYYDACDGSENEKSMHFAYDLMYIHQLQNIYFSATNKELLITLFA